MSQPWDGERGSALRGGSLSQRWERNQRIAGGHSRRDHGSTCVPPESRSPLSSGPPIWETRALGHGARVRRGWWTTPNPPVCAAAVGGSNGRADPTVVSRLPWQNRDSRCKTGGRMICAPTQRPKASRRDDFGKLPPRLSLGGRVVRRCRVPSPKPSPLGGEGGAADAVTDEGPSFHATATGRDPSGSF